ncbi:type II secretion system F family protein [Microtetraspora malaysiensis]|uniref:type II secretion system F family protein n=1 Tax=Microtetraspora malaysiensis TaxID=161358 RepID=UPI003D932903
MATLIAVAFAALAVIAWPARVPPSDRLRAIATGETRRRNDGGETGEFGSPLGSTRAEAGAEGDTKAVSASRLRGLAIAAPAGVVAFLMFGGAPGVVAGVLAAGGAWVIARRRESADVRRRRERMAADLPFAVDLMVACLRAGQPVIGAVDAVAEALGGPLGERLSWVAGQMRLGAEPGAAWGALAQDPSLAPLARAMIRAVRRGAPVAEVLTRLADDARQAARASSSAAARKAGVQAVAPLGLCFLPAFVLLGIIPVVAGLAVQVLVP